VPRRYESQPGHLTALELPAPPRTGLDPDLQKYFEVCEQRIGFVPNVLAAYSFDQVKLRAFIGIYNDLMLGDSGLSTLEREMIAVVVSSANRCYYCQVAHGQAVREAGFKDREIWDIASVASFFNMTNRMATAVDMMPNEEYHSSSR
jgi:AhpD family alkylhydroperoxidase